MTRPAKPTIDRAAAGVRAVDRALDVLLAFRADDTELLVTDLLKRVDLSRPTLYRLLATLERKGFVSSSGDPQRFRLGPAVAGLAHTWSSSLDVARLARPFLLDAWAHTNETVALFVPRGVMRLCIAEFPSAQPISFRRGVGYSERLVRGASGRAILAFESLADGELEAFAAGIETDVAWVRDDLVRTRRRGYALGHNELIQGAYAVAAPFFDGSSAVAGSIGVFGPDVRLSAARMGEFGVYLRRLGQDLSGLLGKSVDPSVRRP